MRHLSQQMLTEEIRRPHLKRHRRRLQRALQDLTLGPETRKRFMAELAGLGKPKVYDASEPPLPGALNPGPMPQPAIELDLETSTIESLSAIPHTRLYLYALQEGLEVNPGDTKVQTIKTILDAIQGGDR